MNILTVSRSTFTNIDFYYTQDKKKIFFLLIMYICHMSNRKLYQCQHVFFITYLFIGLEIAPSTIKR